MSSQAAFYDELAPRYDALLTAAPIDAWTRRAFQDLVAATVPVGTLLLDFGCGTGLDAEWYAARGYRVLAYDISAGMLEQLRSRCAAQVATGEVIPVHAAFADFPMAVAGRTPDALVANYGVLNAISDPRSFFEAVAPVLAPGAPVIVSVLNPFLWKDTLLRWWSRFRRRATSVTAPVPPLPPFFRHRISHIEAAARPAFTPVARASVGTLVRRYRSKLDWDRPSSLAQKLEARLWRSFPLRSTGMFVFLTLRRT